MLYNASDRVLSEMKKEVKVEQEQRAKAKEAKRRRARSANRTGESLDEEKAYLLGLLDVCPRCGEPLEEMADEEAQRRHLMECTDDQVQAMLDLK